MDDVSPDLPRQPLAAAPRALAVVRARVAEIDVAPSALRMFLAAYFTVLGSALVILPTIQLDGAPSVEDWQRGVITVASGLGLLWLAILDVPARWSRVGHLVAGLPQVAFGLAVLADGLAAPGIFLVVFGMTASLLPPPGTRVTGASRGDALTLILLALAGVQGVATMSGADSSAGLYTALDLSPMGGGAVTVVLAVAAILALLLRASRPLAVALVFLTAGSQAFLIGLAMVVVGPSLLLLSGVSYLRLAALLTYPIRGRMHLDWSSLQSTLAVTLVTLTLAPVIGYVAVAHALGGAIPDLAARQVQYALVSAGVVAAFIGSWAIARALVRPLRRLAISVTRLVEADTPPPPAEIAFTELQALLGGVTTAASRLEAERSENDRLIAELRARNDELARATSVKDEFLGLVSHELKTPVTTIFGNASILARRTFPDDSGEIVADVRAEAERLTAIIDNLLVIARLDAGKRPQTEPVLLAPLVTRAADAIRRQHPEVEIDVQTAPAVVVEANPDHLDMVVRNYLSNAVKYAGTAAPIEVRLAERDGKGEVLVLDRGPGIEGDLRDRVFEPFFRVGATAHSAAGMGIGLAVCRRVVEAVGGTCWVAGREDGGGAVFGFAVPLADVDGEDVVDDTAEPFVDAQPMPSRSPA